MHVYSGAFDGPAQGNIVAVRPAGSENVPPGLIKRMRLARRRIIILQGIIPAVRTIGDGLRGQRQCALVLFYLTRRKDDHARDGLQPEAR